MSQIKLTADSGGGTTSLKAPSSTTSNADVVLKLPVADGSANQVLKTDGSGQLSFGSDISDLVNDTSPQLGGDLDSNGKNISFGDSSGATVNRLTFGAGNDLTIFHAPENSFITETGSGNLKIQASDLILADVDGTEFFRGYNNGQVELSHNGNKKLETTSSGVEIHNDLLLDGSANLGNYIRTNYDGGGHMYFRNNSGSSLNFSSHFQTYRDTDEAGTAQTHIHYYHGGYCELLHQGDSVIRTLANGVQFRDGGAVKGQFTDQGLCFGTDTAAANALDDYEEGTFTPALGGDGNHSTYHVDGSGWYTKVGRKVDIHLTIDNKDLNNSASGTVMITGLPFVSNSSMNPIATTDLYCYNVDFNTSRIQSFYLTSSETRIFGIESVANGAWVSWPVSDWNDSGTYLRLHLVYYAS